MNAVARTVATTISVAMVVALAIAPAAGAAEPSQAGAATDLDKLAGQPADLAPWAYAWRADREVQEKPEAAFVPRRLERLERIFRLAEKVQTGSTQWEIFLPSVVYQGEAQNPTNNRDQWRVQKVTGEWVSGRLLEWGASRFRKEGRMIPSPKGSLHSALLWETLVPWTSIELHWPRDAAVPPPGSVEVRFYPTEFGWFSVVWDRMLGPPKVADDGLTWTYHAADVADVPKDSFARHRSAGALRTDMVAVFVDGTASPAGTKWAVPTIRLVSPFRWKRTDVAIEWGFQPGTENLAYDGRIEGYMAIPGRIAPLDEGAGVKIAGGQAWQSPVGGASRRGIVASLLSLDGNAALWSEPYDAGGRDRELSHLHSRITVWTKAGNFTFLPSDAQAEPILAPEYGFFVTPAGAAKTGREHAQELAAGGKQSILERTRARPEATADEALREIKLPCIPDGDQPPPFPPAADPPMQVRVPEPWWTDVWRMVAQCVKKPQGYLSCGNEAANMLRPLNLIGCPDVLLAHEAHRLKSPGMLAEGDFLDGEGSLYDGQRWDWVSSASTTGQHLLNLVEHYLITRDRAWLETHRQRLQQAADWLIRQRREYMKDVPNRHELWCAGLQPPASSSESWGEHQYRFWYSVDAMSCEALFAWAQALEDVDRDLAVKYATEARQYRDDIRRSVERSIALTPVRKLRSGVWRSYSPGVCYARGPFVSFWGGSGYGCEDFQHQHVLLRSLGWDPGDARLAGSLEVLEDSYLFRQYTRELADRRQKRGRAAQDDWFWGGISRQLGYNYMTDAHLFRDDVPAFLRSWTNNSVLHVNFSPHGRYYVTEGATFAMKNRGEVNGNAAGWLMRNYRNMLVVEIGGALWLAKATPRHWLEQGRTISVKNAPTYFGTVGYEIVSAVDDGAINATVDMPARNAIEESAPKEVVLRFRHPTAAPIKGVTVNGKPWTGFNKEKETITLKGLTGSVNVTARY